MRIIQKYLPKTVRYYLLPLMLFVALMAANVYIYQRGPKAIKPPADIAGVGLSKPLASSMNSDLISVENIKDLAAKEAPHATISKIELRKRNNQLVYVVELTNALSLAFDAQTGEEVPNVTTDNDVVESVLPADEPSQYTTPEPENTETTPPVEPDPEPANEVPVGPESTQNQSLPLQSDTGEDTVL